MATIRYILIAVLTALIALMACTPTSGDKPVVTVSIPPEKYIVEQIAGDRYDVRSILTAGANPESYEPSMAHLLGIERSDAFLKMGMLGFEDAIVDKVHAANPDLRIFNLTDGIEPITGTHGHADRSGAAPSCPDAPDPHTWSSVANARVIAANAVSALSTIDPAGADYYAQNFSRFSERLDSLDTAIKQILAKAPSNAFVVFHPSLSYFARDYGLDQIALGVENKEQSAVDLRRRIDAARETATAGSGAAPSRPVPLVMLIQKDFDSSRAEALNSEIGARIVYINPMNADWIGEMLHIARAIGMKVPQ